MGRFLSDGPYRAKVPREDLIHSNYNLNTGINPKELTGSSDCKLDILILPGKGGGIFSEDHHPVYSELSEETFMETISEC